MLIFSYLLYSIVGITVNSSRMYTRWIFDGQHRKKKDTDFNRNPIDSRMDNNFTRVVSAYDLYRQTAHWFRIWNSRSASKSVHFGNYSASFKRHVNCFVCSRSQFWRTFSIHHGSFSYMESSISNLRSRSNSCFTFNVPSSWNTKLFGVAWTTGKGNQKLGEVTWKFLQLTTWNRSASKLCKQIQHEKVSWDSTGFKQRLHVLIFIFQKANCEGNPSSSFSTIVSEALRNPCDVFHDVSVFGSQHHYILCCWNLPRFRDWIGQEYLHNHPRCFEVFLHNRGLHILEKMRPKTPFIHIHNWLWCDNVGTWNLYVLQIYMGWTRNSGPAHMDTCCMYLHFHHHLYVGLPCRSLGDDWRTVPDESAWNSWRNDNLHGTYFRVHCR